MVNLLNTPAVYRHLAAALPIPYTENHACNFIRLSQQEPGMMELAIVVAGEIAGAIGAQLQGNCATIGYWLGEAYWRQGIMTRALPHFLALLPDRITRVEACVFDFNTASQALLRRCGFTQHPNRQLELAQDGQKHPTHRFTRPR